LLIGWSTFNIPFRARKLIYVFDDWSTAAAPKLSRPHSATKHDLSVDSAFSPESLSTSQALTGALNSSFVSTPT